MATVTKPRADRSDDGPEPLGTERAGVSRQSAWRFGVLLLSILACAMLASNYWYQSRLRQQINYFPYAWKTTWVESPYRGHSFACFRKVIYVEGNVDNAYIAVAADNFFKLTVNEDEVPMYFHPGDSSGFQPGTEPSPYTELGIRRHYRAGSIFNIAKALRPGVNVICLTTESDENRAPRIAVQGEITTGTTQQILSDASWKCSTQEEVRDGVSWQTADFPDSDWPRATVTNIPVTAWVDGDPSVLTAPMNGYFITTPQRNLHAPVFLRTTIDVPPGDNQGWMRLGWTSTYDLVINGTLVSSTSMVDRYGLGIVKSAGADLANRMIQSTGFNDMVMSANKTGTDVYVFENLFHPGRNTVAVTLHGVETPLDWSVPQLYLDGVVKTADGGVTRFQTDSTWRAFSDSSAKTLTPIVLRQPSPLSSGMMTSSGTARTLTSDLAMYEDLASAALVLFAVLLVVSLFIGYATPARSAIDLMTKAAACVVLPTAFMTTAMIVQWVFAWSPQNEYFVTREFGSLVIGCAFILFVLNAAGVLLASNRRRDGVETIRLPIRSALAEFVDRYGFAIGVALITVAGGLLYFRDIGNEAYIPDEYVSMLAAQGILHRGIPIYENSGILYPRSSLYHYTLALFLALSRHENSLMFTRIPSAVCQIALIPLVYIYGRELKSKPVGLVAAAVIAFSPYLEYFAREVRFYSQFAFFATLLFYMLLRSVRNPDRLKYRVGTILAFCAAYLSQQIILGSVPAVFAVLLFARQLHLWFKWPTVKWLIFAACVILADLGAYFVWSVTPLPFIDGMAEPLLGLHTDYMEVLPSLLFDYYEREQLVIGMLFALGFLGVLARLFDNRRQQAAEPAWPWWKFQYLTVPIATAVTVAILPHPEPRYVCEQFPVIAITAVCVAASIVRWVGAWFANEVQAPALARPMQVAFAIAIAALFIAEARPVRSYNSTQRHINRDLTDACRYIRANMQPGDKLMFFTPEVAMIEFGRCEYDYRPEGASLDKYISKDGRLRERNSGAIVIDSADKLRRIMASDRRIWLVVSPISSINAGNTGKLAMANFPVVYETFGTEVLLWDRDSNRYYNAIADHHEDQYDF